MKRWFTQRRMALLFVVLLLLSPIFWTLGRRLWLEWDLYRTLAHLDATEPGWRFADLEAARKKVSDERNAALKWVALSAKIPKTLDFTHRDNRGVEWRCKPAHRLNDAEAASLKNELDKVTEILAQVPDLAEAAEGRFHFNPDKPFAESTAYSTTGMPRLLCAYFDYLVHVGDMDGAMRSWKALFQLIHLIGDEGTSFAVIYKCSLFSRAQHDLEMLLALRQIESTDLEKASRLFSRAWNESDFYFAILGDRGKLPEYFTPKARKAFEEYWRDMPKKREVELWWHYWSDRYAPLDFAGLQTHLLQVHTQILATRDLSPIIRHERLQSILDERNLHPLSKILPCEPLIDRQFKRWLQCQGNIDTSLIAIAAELFRMEKGLWPQTLDELVPKHLAKVPLDPLGKDPYLLRHFDDGIAIYWPGFDKKCEGRGWDPSDDREFYGIHLQQPFQFRLWNPEARGQQRPAPIEKKVDDE